MKFAKLCVIALSLGIFASSCGGGTTEPAHADSTATPPVATTEAPAQPAPTDTTTAPPAKDSAAAAPAGH